MSKNDPKAMIPATVIDRDGSELYPALAPGHTLSGTRAMAGGLIGAAEKAIAQQMGHFDLDMAQANMAKLAEFVEFLKRLAFSKLGPSDFVSYSKISGDSNDDGQPWLTVVASERVAETCGISYGFLTPAMEEEHGEDDQGPYFVRRARMWFQVGSQRIEAIGESDSRDSLLSKGGKLSASQVPRTKIGQKAISRATQIGIGKILGLRGLTWDRIRELVGKDIDPSKVQSAKFKTGGRGGSLNTGKAEDMATPQQVGAIYREWCAAAGRSSHKDNWDANKGPWWDWVHPIIQGDPSRPIRFSDYTMGQLRLMKSQIEEMNARNG